MNRENFPAVYPREQLTADLVNQITSALAQLSGLTDGGDLLQIAGGFNGRSFDARRPVFCRVVSNSLQVGGSLSEPIRYRIHELNFAEEGSSADLSDGIISDYAYEANGRTDVTNETRVLAYPAAVRPDNEQEYLFFCGCTPSTYEAPTIRNEVLRMNLEQYAPVRVDCNNPCGAAGGTLWIDNIIRGSGNSIDRTTTNGLSWIEGCNSFNMSYFDGLAALQTPLNSAAICTTDLPTALSRLGDLSKYNTLTLETYGGPNNFNSDNLIIGHATDTYLGVEHNPTLLLKTSWLLNWLNLGNKRLLVFDYYGIYQGNNNPTHSINPILFTELGSSLHPVANDYFITRSNYQASFFPGHYLTNGLTGSTYSVFQSFQVAGSGSAVPLVYDSDNKVLVAVEKFNGTHGPYEIVFSGNKTPSAIHPAGGEVAFWKQMNPRTRTGGGKAIQ